MIGKALKSIAAVLVVAGIATSVNWLWLLMPAKELHVVVLDKSVHAAQIDRNNNLVGEYRKHRGLFWLMNNRKYIKPGNGGMYRYMEDYFGPVLDQGDNTVKARELEKPAGTADLLYLADAYGDESADMASRGIVPGDMAVIRQMYDEGTTVVGEFNISTDPTATEVRSGLQDIFGLDFSGWSGRFIADLSDRSDVPDWATALYARQYGRSWSLAGSGILLVSDRETLIVLQEGADYLEDSFRIGILPQYAGQFGELSVNYYNWFDVVIPRTDTEVLADYTIGLTAAGKSRVSGVFSEGRFAAITRKTDTLKTAYYFAGEFSDYVEKGDIYCSVAAVKLNTLFSKDKKGNITNFFWKFYVPVVGALLDEAYGDRPAA
jgi:hypothetical protein